MKPHKSSRLILSAIALFMAGPVLLAQPNGLSRTIAASGGTGAAGRAGASGGSYALDQGFGAASARSTPSGATYVVNSANDPGDGTCDAAECTLREAINAANGSALKDAIHFNIPGAGLHSIIPLTALPAVTDAVVIDGYTQPGASPNTLAMGDNAVLRIELNGNGAAFAGLTFLAGGSTVRGLIINRFNGNGPAYGIALHTGGGHVIVGNWIGVDATGAEDMANSRGGIYMDNSAGNIVGGTSPADRNVIVGAGNTAIFDQGVGGGHIIEGNYIGTNAAGTAALARGGIWLVSPDNRIGGTEPGAGNVLSTGGGVPGIFFVEEGASGNTVQGNYIGVTADGTAALAPGGGSAGISMQRAGGNLIGGTEPAARNVIASVNGGILLFGSPSSGAGNTIQGNYIGTNAAGTALLPSGGSAGAGVRIEGIGNTVLGGTAPGAGNVIGGFSTGVMFYGSLPGNVVQGNRIGTNAAGTAALPNNEGMLFAGFSSDDGNVIGGTTDAARNVISGNLGDGIRLNGSDNAIQGNFIGVAADGTVPLGNGANGIEIGEGSRNVIGGMVPGAGNVIAYNGAGPQGRGYGVVVFSGTGNSIDGNAIYGNGRIALNLYGGDAVNGATANDPGDADAGPNNLQNTPEVMRASIEGDRMTVEYQVDTAPANAAYPLRVAFFRAFNGEGGAAFLGTDTYSAADYGGCSAPPCSKTLAFIPTAPLTDFIVATATDAAGNTSEFSALAAAVPAEEAEGLPSETALRAPWPNPAVGRAVLTYSLAEAGRVRLVVYDLLGREVAVLVDGERAAGRYESAVDVGPLAAGVYLARLAVGDRSFTRRLTVLR